MKFLFLLLISHVWATDFCRTVISGGSYPLEVDVRAYYQQIDAGNVAGALSRFASDARYKRGSMELNDLDEIKDFYQRTRTLQGNHTVSRLNVSGSMVRVEGVFEGSSQSKPVRILFTDYWTYDPQSLQVIQRTSILTNEKGEPLNL